jgi:hemerythrin-like domain-containing protein
MTKQNDDCERRRFLQLLGSSAALALTGCGPAGRVLTGRAPGPAEKPAAEEEGSISPAGDLMREHGVLERILLIYEECARRLEHSGEAPLAVLEKGAEIVRLFVEDYHERLEEQSLFPRFEAAQQKVELVSTLRDQHAFGRELTDRISELAGGTLASSTNHQTLVQALWSFSRMYRPHAAREDTVLFPAFERMVGSAAYFELGEQFEDEEHELFGQDDFAGVVREVAGLERELGIHNLAQFTGP